MTEHSIFETQLRVLSKMPDGDQSIKNVKRTILLYNTMVSLPRREKTKRCVQCKSCKERTRPRKADLPITRQMRRTEGGYEEDCGVEARIERPE